MGDKISIIVPVYNAQDYLRKCLDSLCTQTYENLEIILVDDGSVDDSAAICDEYAGNDKRIRVIHQENGGVSSARNAGIEAATGSYVTFCDSDDWMEADAVEYMYDNLKSHDINLVFCGFYRVYGSRRLTFTARCDMILNSEEAIGELMDLKDLGSVQSQPWGQLMKRSVLDNIRFPQGRIYEDTMTTYRIIEAAGGALVLKEAKYNYVQREGSITHGNTQKADLGMCYAYEQRYLDLVQRYPQFKDNMLHRYLFAYTKLARDGVSQENMENFLERREFFRSVSDELYANPYTKWIERLELPVLYRCDGKRSLRLWFLEIIRMTGRIPWKLREKRAGR